MYRIKQFRTYQDQQDWIAKHADRYWIALLFPQYGFAVEYRRR